MSKICAVCAGDIRSDQAFCHHCGSPCRSASVMEGQRRHVAVLFADLVRFTSLSEDLDPEAVTVLLNDVFTRLTAVAEKHGGHLDKYMGDAMMVLFGAPSSSGHDLERAAAAGLEMQEEMEAFRDERNFDLHLRVGINEGLVVAGFVGAPGHRSYTVIGDVVNVAQRLQACAERDEVRMSCLNPERLKGSFSLEAVDPVPVKGRREPVSSWRVRRLTAAAPASAVDRSRRVPLVGRANELDMLVNALEEGPRPSVHVIGGEPGIGRTRLLEELVQHCGGALLVVGQAWVDRPFGSLRRLFKTLVEGRGSAPLWAATPEERQLFLAFLAESFTPPPAIAGLPEARRREAVLRIGADLLLKALHTTGVDALLLDDWDTWDAASRELLAQARRHENSRIAFVIATHGADAGWDDVRRMPLQPLSRDEAVQFLGLLGEVPANERDEAVTRAGGNPLFLAEVSRIRASAGHLHALPSTLQDAVLVRVDRLEPELRNTLATASILGPSVRLLGDLFPEDTELPGQLARLAQEGFLVLEAGSYRFANSLVQEGVYNSVLSSRRRALHGRALALLEQEACPALERVFHAERAGDAPALLRARLQAAREARSAYMLQQVMEHVEAADAVLLGMEQKPADLEKEVALMTARTLTELGRAEESRKLLDRLLEGAISDAERNPLRLMQASNLYLEGAYADAQDLVTVVLKSSENQEEIADAYRWRGILRSATGNRSGALEDFLDALKLFQETRNEQRILQCMGNVGMVYMDRGEVDAALETFHDVIRRSRESQHLDILWRSLGNVGGTLPNKGAFRRARTCLEEGVQIARRVGEGMGPVYIGINLVSVEVQAGRERAARAALEDARAAAARVDAARLRPYLMEADAIVAAQFGGGPDSVLDAALDGERAAAALGDRHQAVHAGLFLLQHPLPGERPEDLIARGEKAIAEAVTLGEELAATARIALAPVMLWAGRPADAEDLVQQARETGERLGQFLLRLRVVAFLGALHGRFTQPFLREELKELEQKCTDEGLEPWAALYEGVRSLWDPAGVDEVDLARLPWETRGWFRLLAGGRLAVRGTAAPLWERHDSEACAASPWAAGAVSEEERLARWPQLRDYPASAHWGRRPV